MVSASRWLLPLVDVLGGRAAVARCPRSLRLARVRRGRRVGLLTDAFACRASPAACWRRDGDRRTRSRRRKAPIVFEPTPDKVERAATGRPTPRSCWLTAEQSNSSLTVDDAVMLKIFRSHPDGPASRGRDEPLPDGPAVSANAPALLGEVSRIAPRRRAPCWRWRRPSCATRAMPGPGPSTRSIARSTTCRAARPRKRPRDDDMRGLHRLRLPPSAASSARMHGVLARPTTIRHFAPQPAEAAEDVDAWIERATGLLGAGARLDRRAAELGTTRPSQADAKRAARQARGA